MRRGAGLAVLAALTVLTAACGGGAKPTAARTPEPSAQSTGTPSPTPTASPAGSPTATASASPRPWTPPTHPPVSTVPSGNGPLADGDYYGFLSAVDVGAHTAKFDVAQWFTGDAANRAAQEDGEIQPGETVPNDYYVRNASTFVRTVPLADFVLVSRVDCNAGCGDRAGTLAGLAESFRTATASTGFDAAYRGKYTSYWLKVERGKVVRIDEQYRP